MKPSEPHTIGTDTPTLENDPIGRFRGAVSYEPQVIADNSGTFVGNALRFATRDEAETYVKDLSYRWTLVRSTRVIESADPVNYAIVDGICGPIKADTPVTA